MRIVPPQAAQLGLAAGFVSMVLGLILALVEGDPTPLSGMLGGFGIGLVFVCTVAVMVGKTQADKRPPVADDSAEARVFYTRLMMVGLGAMIGIHLVWLVNSLPLRGNDADPFWPIVSTLILLVTTFAATRVARRVR
jgi:uncharacterized membrane protein